MAYMHGLIVFSRSVRVVMLGSPGVHARAVKVCQWVTLTPMQKRALKEEPVNWVTWPPAMRALLLQTPQSAQCFTVYPGGRAKPASLGHSGFRGTRLISWCFYLNCMRTESSRAAFTKSGSESFTCVSRSCLNTLVWSFNRWDRSLNSGHFSLG